MEPDLSDHQADISLTVSASSVLSNIIQYHSHDIECPRQFQHSGSGLSQGFLRGSGFSTCLNVPQLIETGSVAKCEISPSKRKLQWNAKIQTENKVRF
jgi:hypothetical protein